MEWIYIGVLLNTIFTGGFPDEEKCLGHKAIMERDHKIVGTCIRSPSNFATGAFSATLDGPGAIRLNPGCSVTAIDGVVHCP